MKLVLSSCDFSHPMSRACILENLPKPIEECQVLFIPNEKANTQKILSGKYRQRLQDIGFSEALTFIFDEHSADAFRELPLDVIYVSGGNTFATLQKLRRCGFDKDLIRYVQNGVTYIGGSAGAHIATKNVAHVARYDAHPSDPCFDDFGLGLFDGILLCHYTKEREAHYKQLVSEGQYTVHVLRDGDSVVIE